MSITGCINSKKSPSLTQQQSYSYHSTTLAGADALNRTLPDHNLVGDKKNNKQVGLFYFLWQGDAASQTSEGQWDLNKIVPNHPEVLEDPNNPNWGSTNKGKYYFWGEPIYGYYSGDDYWVHLKNMKLLTDADIDFLVIDATNTIIYPEQSKALMQAIVKLQEQGANPPKIVYYTNTQSGKTIQRIHDTFYNPTSQYYYPSTWYYLEDKPLIIGISEEIKGTESETFFTMRESQWPNEADKTNGWPWIDFKRPQTVYKNASNEREIINVSVAQHPNPAAGMGGSAFYGNNDNWGRSFRNNDQGNPEEDILYGFNFQEQWDYAIEQDVPFVFITGWNEWIAGRWESPDGNKKHSYFCDQASPEYSRDIEPSLTSNLKDNYYLQMIANIRRYKGVDRVQIASKEKTIKSLSSWDNVLPVYYDYTGDIDNRNHPSAEPDKKVYSNNTGRNDIKIIKVARNKDKIWFYAQTTNEITENTGDNWMRLYINTDRKSETGWNGYDYRVINSNELQKFENNKWETFANVDIVKNKNEIMYSLPLSAISQESNSLNFEFKWSDNMQDEDPMDWYINGDVAPEGRLNFVYKTK